MPNGMGRELSAEGVLRQKLHIICWCKTFAQMHSVLCMHHVAQLIRHETCRTSTLRLPGGVHATCSMRVVGGVTVSAAVCTCMLHFDTKHVVAAHTK